MSFVIPDDPEAYFSDPERPVSGMLWRMWNTSQRDGVRVREWRLTRDQIDQYRAELGRSLPEEASDTSMPLHAFGSPIVERDDV